MNKQLATKDQLEKPFKTIRLFNDSQKSLIQYYKDEAEKVKGIDFLNQRITNLTKDLNTSRKDYNQLKERYDILASKYDKAKEVERIISPFIECTKLKKKITIIECNTGRKKGFCDVQICYERHRFIRELQEVTI